MIASERGTAAVELAGMLIAVVGVLVLIAPLAGVLSEQIRLGRTAGRTARFATSVPDVVRTSCSGTRVGRRPSTSEVVAEAGCAHFEGAAVGPDFVVEVSRSPNATLPGTEIEVTVSNTVDLGTLGALLTIVGVDPSYAAPTLSATATYVEE